MDTTVAKRPAPAPTCTPAELLVLQRASADWAPTTGDLALAHVADGAAYMRAYGQRDTRWLDVALRVSEAMVVRDLGRAQLKTARRELGLQTSSKGATR